MKVLLAFAALVMSAATTVAQATLVVGPGGFSTIDGAFAAAAPGDIVLVHPGTYAMASSLDKGVTMRA
ncbi:MAG: hypothetical protein KDC98_22945, partial [Planctomycetes bacterium]|nr:hypothetical protein [Planctomycetota bacterium]